MDHKNNDRARATLLQPDQGDIIKGPNTPFYQSLQTSS
jgi:hypothetical protein